MEEQISSVLNVIKNGGVVVVPTETMYGFVADATNQEAVARIQAIKGRDETKTPPLVVASRQMAEQYLQFSPVLKQLADQYWPGPLTLVGPAKDAGLAPAVVREDGTIAVRISSHPFVTSLSETLGKPLVATSANRAGKSACYTIEAVQEQFSDQHMKPDMYVDGGKLIFTPASTIVKEEHGQVVVLRQGAITL